MVPKWDFFESPVQGLYTRRLVYEKVTSLDDFQPWLDRIAFLPEEVLERACNEIPHDWITGDRWELERLVQKLLERRTRIPDLLSDARRAQNNPFPNWR